MARSRLSNANTSRRATRLRSYFDNNDGRLIDKWMHYFSIYEHHFASYRGTSPTVLEIGISHGGSLEMWREYFGADAHIVGVDVLPRVKALEAPGISIAVGDQGDVGFLDELGRQHGPFDVVVDDGSHLPHHQIVSIETLWKHMRVGGTYLVEDLHTNYWAQDYDGGLGKESTFVEWTKRRFDDLHARHSREEHFVANDWTYTLGGIHLYDSVAVFDRRDAPALERKMTGVPAFDILYDTPVDEWITDEHRAQIAAGAGWRRRVRRLTRHPVRTTKRVIARSRNR